MARRGKLDKHAVAMGGASERLLDAAAKAPEQVLKEYRTDMTGLTQNSVRYLRKKHGRNEIVVQKKDTMFKRLVRAFVNPFTIVLFILAAVSVFTDVIMADKGEADPTAPIIIAIMVTISGVLNFVQEKKSSDAADKLKAMVKTTILVQRKKGQFEIPINWLVVGDIIKLSAGDMIPADVRLLRTKELFISQSSLTGESEPVVKSVQPQEGLPSPLSCSNLAFMGSTVASGSGDALVIGIGNNTILGSMAKQVAEKKPMTSFEKGVHSVSWLLIRFMAVMAPTVFIINGWHKGDFMQAFLFALSVAVGLTPQMLPMIVSVNLSKSAVAMSRKKVIVKQLNSIQNLGAIDILCTDKTGTLTQDKIVLEHYLDSGGNDDPRVLKHAFLNSYFQTGLKNLMDQAVIRHKNDEDVKILLDQYNVVDEIPYDFNRRRMSVVVADKAGKTQLITKGALEEILNISSRFMQGGKVVTLTDKRKAEISAIAEKYSDNGMRILGVTQKHNPPPVDQFGVKDESDMLFIGFLAFMDPPKESAVRAIKALKDSHIRIKVLTGDSDAVTRYICKKVGLDNLKVIKGDDVARMSREQLAQAAEEVDIFAKLSPSQKEHIITLLRENGHVVGYLGDGINDAPALRAADVGISVDTATDISKETANIILLEKDLTVLNAGVVEGRKTYANIIKYIKMTASSNFGNMFSVLVASAFLPFLPMLPIQILLLNLIYDSSCTSLPWDNVDSDFLAKPRKWDASSIGKFMFWIGPTSSVFDITTYLLMFFIICPMVVGTAFGYTTGADRELFISVFHTGWFVESLWTQTLVIHMIRTPKIPFLQSRASWQVMLLTTCGIMIGTLLPYTKIGAALGMSSLPFIYFPWLFATLLGYMVLVSILKGVFIRKYGQLL